LLVALYRFPNCKTAKSEGVSLNQLINLAVAEKISALRTEEFFRERRPRANVEKARKILKRAGKEAARESDEISKFSSTEHRDDFDPFEDRLALRVIHPVAEKPSHYAISTASSRLMPANVCGDAARMIGRVAGPISLARVSLLNGRVSPRLSPGAGNGVRGGNRRSG